MAIYHCSVKIISRSSGRSSVGAAAYRSGERIRNEQDGRIHNYRNRDGIEHTEIILPDYAPAQFRDRAVLWNAVEQAEKRKDAQTAREVEVALPIEFSPAERMEVLREYVSRNFVPQGMVADIAIHDKQDGNPHAHIMLTTREIDIGGFGKKERAWNAKDLLSGWRESWAAVCNERLERHAVRIDHRTLAAQGVDRVPQIHIGANATAAARKDMAVHEGRTVVRRYMDNFMIGEYNRGGMDKRDLADFITDVWRLPKVENTIAKLERDRPAEVQAPAALPAHEGTAGVRRADPQQPDRAADWAKVENLTGQKKDIEAARSEIFREQRSLEDYKHSLDSLRWGNRHVKKNLRESIAKTEKRLIGAKESFLGRFGFPVHDADRQLQKLDKEISERTPKKESIKEKLQRAKVEARTQNAERAKTRGDRPIDRGDRGI